MVSNFAAAKFFSLALVKYTANNLDPSIGMWTLLVWCEKYWLLSYIYIYLYIHSHIMVCFVCLSN